MTYIMVAPNGARRTTSDHHAIPVTDDALIETAKACFQEGVRGIHAHIRTADQRHLLDISRYEALIKKLHAKIPCLEVQITSEAAGVYEVESQIDLLSKIHAPWVSVAIREIIRQQNSTQLSDFFTTLLAKARVQFILYDETDLVTLVQLIRKKIIETPSLEVLYVLGRYSKDQESTPNQLDPFLGFKDGLPFNLQPKREMICAFGKGQIPCLLRAASEGIDCRIGFENGIWLSDGSIVANNSELVRAFIDELPSVLRPT